jgi:hypothetical protein
MIPICAPDSWLFVKGRESIWIMHVHGNSLDIYGPGASQKHCCFDSESALEGFQVWTAGHLISEGWLLWGADRDRREAGDRRQGVRTTPDRRMPAAAQPSASISH